MSGALRTGGLGAGLCLLAGAFAVPSLYVPGAGLLLLALAATGVVRSAARGARVELELDDVQVQEGERVALAVSVRGRLARLCRAELRAAPVAPWRALGRRAQTARLELRPHRRGSIAVGPAAVRYGDPFGMCARERRSPVRRLLVLPRLEPVRRRDLERILAHPVSRAGAEPDAGIDGLGPYRPGAPASRIHWLTVARSGTLMERRAPDGAAAAAVTVVLDTSSPVSEEALDMAVRAAASLCAGLGRRSGCSLLLPGRQHAQALGADMSRWPHVHAQLALVESGRAPEWRAAGGARRLLLVQAREPEARERGAPAVAFTVSPLPRPRRAVLFEVAGCAVQAAHRLDAARAA